MDSTTIEILSRALSWFFMVGMAVLALALIVLQALLPRAWEQIRAQPPRGPDWAHTLWYRRERVYGAAVAMAGAGGALAALVAMFREMP